MTSIYVLSVKCIYLLYSSVIISFWNFCLQINFIISVGILVIKLQLPSYKFVGCFYETKLKTSLIDSTVLISCENCFFWKMQFEAINIYSFLIWLEYSFNQFTNSTSLYINLLKLGTILFLQCRLNALTHFYV